MQISQSLKDGNLDVNESHARRHNQYMFLRAYGTTCCYVLPCCSCACPYVDYGSGALRACAAASSADVCDGAVVQVTDIISQVETCAKFSTMHPIPVPLNFNVVARCLAEQATSGFQEIILQVKPSEFQH